jgi:hypothetical protein
MGCESWDCNEKRKINEAKQAVQKEAKRIANKTGEWVGFYFINGEAQFAIGEDAVGKPITAWATPDKLPDAIV